MIALLLSIISFFYIIYIYSLWLSIDKIEYTDYHQPVSVIIPCYKEGFQELIECVTSCMEANGEKEVILIDNNNDPNSITCSAINHLSTIFPNLIIEREVRQGKRFAHSTGLNISKYKLVVFVDSDTILDKNALIEIVKPMQDDRIGAVCGNIKLKNPSDNFLTRCLETMYWNSFDFYRQAISGIGYLYVCSGALSCYRKEALLKLEDEYLNQEFMGVKCSISDDTFMTVRLQTRLNYKIAYQNESIGYTYSPNKIKGFWKQLVRWRQGFLRETLLMWKEPKKNIIPLFLDAQINLILQSTICFMRVYFFIWLIFSFDISSLVFYLTTFITSSLLMSSAQIIIRPKKIFYILAYSFIYDFFFIFTFVHALIKIRSQGTWGTR